MIRRIIAALLSIAGMALAQTPIPFNTGEWEPFTSSSLPNMGCATELVAAACQAGGLEPSFHFYPWLRTEFQVESGSAFAAFPYAMNEDRKVRFDFSEPLFFTTPRFIFYNKLRSFAHLKATTLMDLKPYRVAILAGSHTEEALKQAGVTVHTAPGLENIVRMLQAGRVDFILEVETVAFDAIQKTFPAEADHFESLSDTFWPRVGAYLMVSRKYPNAQALLKKFNMGLQEIQKNGVYKLITTKYRMTVK